MRIGYEADLERLRAYLKSGAMSIRGLAGAAGVSRPAVNHIFAPDFNPRLATLKKLLAVVPAEFTPSERTENAARTAAQAEG